MVGNPVHVSNAARIVSAYPGKNHGTPRDHRLAEAMLRRLKSAQQDSVVYIPWEEWDGYCRVIDDHSGG